MTERRITELDGIEMVSGMTEDRKPFVTISATDTDGNRMVGQLPPAEVRAHAMAYHEVAEAAEMDSMVARFLMDKLDVTLDIAAQIVGDLRHYRETP